MYVKASMVPWSGVRGRLVCDKWRMSHHAFTPLEPHWRYRLNTTGDLIMRNESTGLLLSNQTECLDACDDNDKCVAVSFRRDGRCIMMTQCFLSAKQSDYRYFKKEKFLNNATYDYMLGVECKSPYPPILTHKKPITIPQCWDECKKVEGCNYAEIDDNLECVLYSECEMELHSDFKNRRGIVIYNSTWGIWYNDPPSDPTSSPSSSPSTMSPSPTAPTNVPTASVTNEPTTSVTNEPTTSGTGTDGPTTSGPTTISPTTSDTSLSSDIIALIAVLCVVFLLITIALIVKFFN